MLHLGVVDVGYSDKEGKNTTTGDVAEYLENDYHIMRTFLELNEQFIAEKLVDQVAGMIEGIGQGRYSGNIDKELQTQLNGRSLTGTSFAGKIEECFRDFLDSGEMQRTLPPTQPVKAAVVGVNHRKIKPNAAANKPRQAFIDTGLYQASFRVWVS